jgi:outer membrane protein assembly factor BamD (BamD/ComL family)
LLLRFFLALGALLIIGCRENTLSEEELFTQARDYESAQQYDNALQSYETIIEKYPDSPNRYKAIFMKGYLYMDALKDGKKAVTVFDQLISEYPDCDLADDAQVLRDVAAKGADLMSVFDDSVKAK